MSCVAHFYVYRSSPESSMDFQFHVNRLSCRLWTKFNTAKNNGSCGKSLLYKMKRKNSILIRNYILTLAPSAFIILLCSLIAFHKFKNTSRREEVNFRVFNLNPFQSVLCVALGWISTFFTLCWLLCSVRDISTITISSRGEKGGKKSSPQGSRVGVKETMKGEKIKFHELISSTTNFSSLCLSRPIEIQLTAHSRWDNDEHSRG